MSKQDLERLRSIKTLPSLLKYLREELDWPVEAEDPEDATFEYTPDELGIDPESAPRIKEIRQLRPLANNQPWGIFWINFEPKRLPIVLLRRLLSGLAIKRRASIKHLKHHAWHLNDLLFISAYGEEGDRAVTFAHFSESPDAKSLPTLKVLGWDDQDTTLHLDYAHQALLERLNWDPRYENDVDAWRQRWAEAFELRHREVIETSKELATRLAELASRIRRRVRQLIGYESEGGPLRSLHKAFREALIHDLTEDDFSDTYAQTVTYGLLSARIANPKSGSADDFTSHMHTNPFLRDLMASFLRVGKGKSGAGRRGIDFDELGISEVVQLLDDAKMEAVLRDFGDRNPQEDPVIHFYELFLKEYDAERRIQRGVFYTPRPIVSYIINSIDDLLRTKFGLADGLADISTWGEMAKRNKGLAVPEGVSPDDTFLQILDPAVGTGTFLVEAVDLIHRTLVAKWKAQGEDQEGIIALWNQYVPKHLLSRLYGYELMMAPYAIAHLKVGLKLLETGYRFESEARAGIFLTNSLEPAQDFSGHFEFAIPALALEAKAVNNIKRHKTFTAVIGNPPYSARSYNLTPYARDTVKRYKFINSERISEKGALQLEKNLNDDYVKFLCLSQVLTQGHIATVGFITNHSFLENPTLRGLRWNLISQYPWMSLLDLGGNVARHEKGIDENVFDITQGVAISILATPPQNAKASIQIGRLRGGRTDKYTALSRVDSNAMNFQTAVPVGPLYLFRSEDVSLRKEYDSGISLATLFPVQSTGVKTHRDAFCIDFELEPLKKRIWDLISKELSDSQIREKYGLEDTYGWALKPCRAGLRKMANWESAISRILYRPFDWRYIYFSPLVVELARMEVSRHFLRPDNLGLVFMRQVASDELYTHFAVTRTPVDNRCFYSNRGTMSFAPLYIGLEAENGSLIPASPSEQTTNLDPETVRAFRALIGNAEWTKRGPKTLLYYGYGVLQSPSYRSRYADFLKVDFPKLPLPKSEALYMALASLGQKLAGLHLLESVAFKSDKSTFMGPRNPEVVNIGWSNDTVWLDSAMTKKSEPAIPGTIGFRGVSKAVWDLQIGGYQVSDKWLKDRKGRRLSTKDIVHYQRIIVALAETIEVMKEIDSVIEEHGGWPGAFLANQRT